MNSNQFEFEKGAEINPTAVAGWAVSLAGMAGDNPAQELRLSCPADLQTMATKLVRVLYHREATAGEVEEIEWAIDYELNLIDEIARAYWAATFELDSIVQPINEIEFAKAVWLSLTVRHTDPTESELDFIKRRIAKLQPKEALPSTES